MTRTLKESKKESKKWYQRKRVWAIVIFVLLVYFCFVPSRLRISPETTGIAKPLTADGRVDYFAAYENMYIDKLTPPENNGQRLLIAACGPRILKQNSMADEVGSWEKLPTHDSSKKWFNDYWIPLCEHLYIDPHKKPMFYDKRNFRSFMFRYFKEQQKYFKDSPQNTSLETEIVKELGELYDKLTAGTWKKEDYPQVIRWLDEYSEVMDYFGTCVRKPNFVNWRQRPSAEYDSLITILLYEVQSNREFADSLQVRICERISRGDIDGAWYDIMSLKYLARHYVNSHSFVINIVGFHVSRLADKATKLLLIYCKPNEKQLAKFINDLDNLPKYNPLISSLESERLTMFQIIQQPNLYMYPRFLSSLDGSDIDIGQSNAIIILFSLMPFDMNIAGKRLTKIYKECELKNEKNNIDNPILRRQYIERFKEVRKKYVDKMNIIKQFYRIPLIRTRSELLAESIFVFSTPPILSGFILFDCYEALNEMQRLSINLERYKLANGKYPNKLDDLVPKYIDIIPIDPCTGRATFVYKLSDPAKEKTKTTDPPTLNYILYSLGPNRKDDNGTPKKENKGKEYDIVF
ncbi:MAG: hypothetical protein LBP59_07320 [Planctomycetaceae bacterium]|jgi:hypothetical protein|nr:hypothetical protein [Planctomycetaceae bacterium]